MANHSSQSATWGSSEALFRSFELARANEFNEFVSVAEQPATGKHPRGGALAGIPFGVKDNIDVAGLPTTCSSKHRTGVDPAGVDARVVAQLKEAGAVVVGKTQMHEFAYGITGTSSAFGAARNPVDVNRVPGGSSSGSAVAVAAGITPFSLATDTGGSARIPASFCGIVGFKPTTGILSNDGVFPTSHTFDTVGIMGRDVGWVSIVWTALAGEKEAPRALPEFTLLDPASLPAADPQVADLVAGAVPGAVSAPAPSFLAEVSALYSIIAGRDAHDVHADMLASQPSLYQPDILARLTEVSLYTTDDYDNACARREELLGDAEAWYPSGSFLVLPTTPVVAPAVGEQTCRIGGSEVPVREAILSLTRMWSVLGWPAISLPVGSIDGLPVGLQIVGPAGSDATLLAAAQTLETSITRGTS